MSQQEQQLQEFYEMKLKMAALENESNSKIALLETKLQMAEAAHLEEKITLLEEKQIQEQKNIELETKMRYILARVKNVGNPEGTHWKEPESETWVTISSDGLQAKVRSKQTIFANQGFPISAEHCRKDPFLWTIYYYEVKQISQYGFAYWAGLSNGEVGATVGSGQNSYSVPYGCDFYIDCGRAHNFEWPDRAMKPEWKGLGNVVGCGLLISRNGKMSLFFTLNGILLGRQIPIEPKDGERLFPTVTIWDMTLEANFGDDLTAKPFMYDSLNCPGLDLK